MNNGPSQSCAFGTFLQHGEHNNNNNKFDDILDTYTENSIDVRQSRPRNIQPKAQANPAPRPLCAFNGKMENSTKNATQNRLQVNFILRRGEAANTPRGEKFLEGIERRSLSRSLSRGRQSLSKGQSPGRTGKRQPYKPPKINDYELFDASKRIEKGDKFDQVYGEHAKAIVWETGGRGVDQKKLEEYCKKKTDFKQIGITNEHILKSLIAKKMGNPTPIQKMVIRIIRKKRNDLLGHAPTGSGKTAAYLLPIINELHAVVNSQGGITNTNQPYVIIPVPTKELANQLYEDAKAFALCTGVTVVRTCGNIQYSYSLQELNAGCDILIATCGRLQDFIENGYIKLDKLRYLVLDEADKLLQIDGFSNCIKIIKRNELLNTEHRVLMFSATFSAKVRDMAREFLRENCIRVQIGLENLPVETVAQQFIQVKKAAPNVDNDFDKKETLRKFLMDNSTYSLDMQKHKDYFKAPKTIVFVNDKRKCYMLSVSMAQSNFRVDCLSSDSSLKDRYEKVAKFATDKIDVLIATDVAARGLNFSGVEYVINLDLPLREPHHSQDEYIHRIGRTGRNGNLGHSISYFDPTDPVDCQNAPYYVEKLQESRAKVPDWLRQIAKQNNAAQQDMNNEQPAGGKIQQQQVQGEQPQIIMESADDDDDAIAEMKSLFSMSATKPSSSAKENNKEKMHKKATARVKPKTFSNGNEAKNSSNNSSAAPGISRQRNDAVNDWVSSTTKR